MADILRMGRKAVAPFDVGATVALNSGGPWMTVRSCEGDLVTVDWCADTGEPYSTNYPAAMLYAGAPEEEKLDA